jgi:TonB family protein
VVNHITFVEAPVRHIPPHRRVVSGAFATVLVLHIALFLGVVIAGRSWPVRVTPGALSQVGIAAFNPGALGTAGTSSPNLKPASPATKTTPTRAIHATPAVADEPAESGQAGGAPGTAGGGGSGPVRLGSGEGLTLLTKVTPTYPHTMESARIPGTVVLDATIRRDGTIGDIKILQSTNAAFAQAAADAVKRWRYTSLPYEGIVTVTVNFTLPR